VSTTPPETASGETGDTDLRDALGMSVRPPPAKLAPGQVIDDAYRIERKLGAGGMGAVYLARDLRLHRDVAIKVHTAVTGERGGARLQREAAAMAQLVHPHVVTVHEVGMWAGHPYVAMEYVAGGTARTWLTTSRTTREILALFVAAGRGLAAAHAVGIVHRDFKPDNVLVGDDGRVRVADFGLARGFDDEDAITSSAESPLTELTATGAVVGTPAYMAPEQRQPGKIGPAADQFAFAVALWEALCGERPFAGNTAAQIAAAIAGGELRTPTRGRMPAHVERALRRALAADPAAQRRKLAWIGAATVAVVGAGAGAVLVTRDDPEARAARTCSRAGDRIAETWTPEHRAAIERSFVATGRGHAATTAAKVGDALDDFASSWSAHRIEACVATNVRHEQTAALLELRGHCLDRKRDDLAALITTLEHPLDPSAIDRAVDASLAIDTLDECDDVPRLTGALPRPTDPAILATLEEAEALVAQARADSGIGKFPDGLAAAQAGLAKAEAAGYAPVTAIARLWVGYLQQSSGDAAARATFDAATRDAAAAHDDVLAAEIWVALFHSLTMSDELSEAERLLPYAEAAIVRAGTPAELDAELASAQGMMRARQGKWDEAGPLLARAVARTEEHFGPDAPALAQALNVRSNLLRQVGDYAAARTDLERALAILEKAYGSEHPHIAKTLHNLASVLLGEGRLEEARATLERVIGMKERVLGPEHPDLANSLSNLGQALVGLRRPAEALPHLERARALAEKKYGPEHPAVGRAISVLGDVKAALGDQPGARADLEHALVILEPALGAESPEVVEIYVGLGDLKRRANELGAARRDLDHALEAFEATRGPEHTDVARVLMALAALDLATKDPAAAQRRAERATAIFEKIHAAELAMALTVLADALAAQGHPDEALTAAERAARIHAEAPYPDPTAMAETSMMLADLLWKRDPARAQRLAGEARDAWTAAGFADDAKRAAAWLAKHR